MVSGKDSSSQFIGVICLFQAYIVQGRDGAWVQQRVPHIHGNSRLWGLSFTATAEVSWTKYLVNVGEAIPIQRLLSKDKKNTPDKSEHVEAGGFLLA